jgi:hypothetical protein
MDKLVNLATWDRIARVVLGLALLSLVFGGPQTSWGWLGLVLIATAAVGVCPLYLPFGINTRKLLGK